ncbi:hypothetical protein [Tsuneonella sp. HG222]
MWSFLKSIVLGAGLTLVVCLFIGSAGGTGGFLHIRHFTIEEFGFFWSWTLFVAGTALSFGLFALMA